MKNNPPALGIFILTYPTRYLSLLVQHVDIVLHLRVIYFVQYTIEKQLHYLKQDRKIHGKQKLLQIIFERSC